MSRKKMKAGWEGMAGKSGHTLFPAEVIKRFQEGLLSGGEIANKSIISSSPSPK
jgi:hypothetical protein